MLRGRAPIKPVTLAAVALVTLAGAGLLGCAKPTPLPSAPSTLGRSTGEPASAAPAPASDPAEDYEQFRQRVNQAAAEASADERNRLLSEAIAKAQQAGRPGDAAAWLRQVDDGLQVDTAFSPFDRNRFDSDKATLQRMILLADEPYRSLLQQATEAWLAGELDTALEQVRQARRAVRERGGLDEALLGPGLEAGVTEVGRLAKAQRDGWVDLLAAGRDTGWFSDAEAVQADDEGLRMTVGAEPVVLSIGYPDSQSVQVQGTLRLAEPEAPVKVTLVPAQALRPFPWPTDGAHRYDESSGVAPAGPDRPEYQTLPVFDPTRPGTGREITLDFSLDQVIAGPLPGGSGDRFGWFPAPLDQETTFGLSYRQGMTTLTVDGQDVLPGTRLAGSPFGLPGVRLGIRFERGDRAPAGTSVVRLSTLKARVPAAGPAGMPTPVEGPERMAAPPP